MSRSDSHRIGCFSRELKKREKGSVLCAPYLPRVSHQADLHFLMVYVGLPLFAPFLIKVAPYITLLLGILAEWACWEPCIIVLYRNKNLPSLILIVVMSFF